MLEKKNSIIHLVHMGTDLPFLTENYHSFKNKIILIAGENLNAWEKVSGKLTCVNVSSEL